MRTNKHMAATMTAALAVAMVVSTAGAPAVLAVPGEQGGTTPSSPGEQGGTTPSAPGGEQGGTSPLAPGGEQGGTTPTPPPPAPAPAPTPPGPGVVPGPPPGQWQPAPSAPTGPIHDTPYDPAPSGPIHAPRYTPPVKRIAPPPKTLRVGNFQMPVKDVPDIPNKTRTVNSVNAWASYAEAEIARGLISIGIPEDEASRKAAATVLGAAAAGAVGGIVVFTTTTIIVGVVTVPLGAVIGGTVAGAMSGGNPLAVAGGAGIGAAGGAGVALASGFAAGSLGALLAAAAGGTLAYLLGTGDPGSSAKRPKLPWEQGPGGSKHRKDQMVASGDRQYELMLSPDAAAKAGLPPVEYVVTSRGDVQAAAKIGEQVVQVGWTAEQAAAPIAALGPAAPAAQKAVDDTARAVSSAVESLVPGAVANWGQPKTKTGRASR